MNSNQAFKILTKASNTNDARIICRKIFGQKEKLNILESLKIFIAAKKLKRGIPVAKIIREKWFYGLSFYTNKYTLDPRPDSETLVEAVLQSQNYKNLKILDLGTGTGCLICSIVKNLPDATGIGIDKSYRAICVANKNVKKLGLKNKIKILHMDFNKPLSFAPKSFDIIISNPPYIANNDKRVNLGASHDPKIALYAGTDGLDAYYTIAKNARILLKPNGRIFLEIGINQGKKVREIFTKNNWKFVKSYKDLSGIERVLKFI